MRRKPPNRPTFLATVTLLAALICGTHAALAEAPDRPKTGLLRNYSGLPATLPLQVMTDPGQDFLAELRDPDTGALLLSAYVRGGAFFRVLVPPGQAVLRFTAGNDWSGERLNFSAPGETITLPPLRFGVVGLDRRGGYLIDLRRRAPDRSGDQAATVRDIGICQTRSIDADALKWTPGWAEVDLINRRTDYGTVVPHRPKTGDPADPDHYGKLRYDRRSRLCD
ncbi:hypothetical protein [Paracoccus pacificus]|uniref:Uncharacterized protein n=1 Tax=Paracoccus pacificus TaxID=1463598 RepID=A0ABW4R712_9RHOB